MADLCKALPELSSFVFENKFQTKTINFSDPKAVKALNRALLFKYYNIDYWQFPDTNLCPPIPGRVDYIHYLANLIKGDKNEKMKILDIGTGASCIYPILGYAEYNWDFVATDIDENSIGIAQLIVNENNLQNHIELRLQRNLSNILKGVIKDSDSFTASMCNPPFYKSEAEANESNATKRSGLKLEDSKALRNFSGNHNELWYPGGEKAFIHNYLYESSLFKDQCKWFTTLVSKKDLLKGINKSLTKLGATKMETINMGQGNKISRIVAWSFQ